MPHVKLIFLLLFFFPLIAQAQVEIFLASGSSSFLPEEVFAFRLQNHHSAPQRVYVTARLKTSREILFLQSAPVLLAPGGRTFLSGEIPVVHMEGVESLPAGVYTFCLSVIQEDNGQELGTQCVFRKYRLSGKSACVGVGDSAGRTIYRYSFVQTLIHQTGYPLSGFCL
ncbi:MAG: hypothetical protein R3C61_25440 [Bacteroidia bacterium]